MMSDIDKILAERGARYGDFKSHANIAQGLKKVMWNTYKWSLLSNDKKQALEVICDKIARILNGDPEYVDNFADICGYSQLIVNELTKNVGTDI